MQGPHEERDDTQLIALAKRGNRTALADLLHRHYSFLYKYLLKLTMNPHAAEDLAQDTMLKAMEKIGLYQGQSKFSSWLITIATRLYIDSGRKQRRESGWQEQERRRQQSLRGMRWQAASAGGDWPAALDALAALPDETRLPIVLKHYYGYSYEEIAAMTGTLAGTVKSRVHYGIASLRKELTNDEEA